MAQQVLSVSEINAYIKSKMDADPILGTIAVRGEISNYKMYPSGHHYFTVKDETAALKCVMFRGNALRLRFRPDNGMQVIVMGSISVYPRDGAYQLYCTAMTVDGVGDLYAAFEQLKEKLAAQGLFDQTHKKHLPRYPGVIGIITSEAGAAVHDMLRILKKRYPLTMVKLLPVRVQGTEAPGEIAAAIRYANRYRLADLLIVGRGGGSIEDLLAFNDETVCRAIFNSDIPVISAVGHEPDVTLSDYVADMRAATPSNAAELAVPDQDNLRQTLEAMMSTLSTAALRRVQAARTYYKALSASPGLQSPLQYIAQRRNALKLSESQLLHVQQRSVSLKRQQFTSLTVKLDAMSPLKVLSRGYAMAQSTDGSVIRSVKQTSPGEQIRVQLTDGTLNALILETEDAQHES